MTHILFELVICSIFSTAIINFKNLFVKQKNLVALLSKKFFPFRCPKTYDCLYFFIFQTFLFFYRHHLLLVLFQLDFKMLAIKGSNLSWILSLLTVSSKS